MVPEAAHLLGTSIEDRPASTALCGPPGPRRRSTAPHDRAEHALGTESRTAVIDNGSFGTREITFSTGRLAKQAAGSVIVQLGETTVLSATTAGKQPKEHFDFFPLTVDVEERMYAAGRIPGSFFRREGRPSEDAILTCRLIDRPLRPSFTKGLRNEVQVVETDPRARPGSTRTTWSP